MLAFGYAGETGLLEAWIGFFFGMCGWGYILFEIFKGEAGGVSGECSAAVKDSFNYMRWWWWLWENVKFEFQIQISNLRFQ